MKKYICKVLITGVFWLTTWCHAESESLLLVGEANMRVLFWPVYNSRLYTDTGTYYQTKRPIKLEITYLRSIKADYLLDRTVVEWQHLGHKKTVYQSWINKLEQIWPDINKNDVLTLFVDKDNKSSFYWNNRYIGSIEDEKFGEIFLAIWLSPSTSEPEHRLALIGENK